jgi:iron(III) transport system permease protein
MRSKWSGVLDTVTFLPHALPGVVIGVTLIIFCMTPPFNELHLYGTLAIVVIGMTISYLSFGSRTMTGAMSQIHLEMEEAAMTAGATWRVVMQRIVLPLLMPAFISGWIWVATHAFRNFSVPVLLASRENKVLSVILWHTWDDGDVGQATALGVGLMAVLIVLTAGGRWLVVKVSRQQES